jgi:cytochrome c oxidase assembly factor CtaG
VNLGINFSLFSIALYVLMAIIPFFVVMSYPVSPSDQPVPNQYNLFP